MWLHECEAFFFRKHAERKYPSHCKMERICKDKKLTKQIKFINYCFFRQYVIKYKLQIIIK